MAKFSKNLKRVEAAFDRERLAQVCILPEESFAKVYNMQTYQCDQKAPHDFYHFKDNGANVLAVAHLDTVADASTRVARFVDTAAGPVVYSRALDDRLGAYIILDLLPALGIQYDILLTTGEEMGASTAAFFDAPAGKDYDWIIEFDRGGTDVVLYEYEDKETIAAVRATGAIVGSGSFSDICYLEHLGVKGFNWGVGYRDYHGPRAHAYLDDTFEMVARYLKFHQQNEGHYFPHTPSPWARRSRSAWWDDDIAVCPIDDVDESTIFDVDYYDDNPSLEDLMRLEERLDYEAAQRRLREWDQGIVRAGDDHLYADWIADRDKASALDASLDEPTEDDIRYASWLSRVDR